jgi:hypothetical protein
MQTVLSCSPLLSRKKMGFASRISATKKLVSALLTSSILDSGGAAATMKSPGAIPDAAAGEAWSTCVTKSPPKLASNLRRCESQVTCPGIFTLGSS